MTSFVVEFPSESHALALIQSPDLGAGLDVWDRYEELRLEAELLVRERLGEEG